MVLPLNLAMTPAEMSSADGIPTKIAWMACHFSPYTLGISNIPSSLPGGSMLILNDRFPCQGHSPSLAAQQLQDAADRLECESVLLDFQRPPEPEAEAVVRSIVDMLPVPVAVTAPYAHGLSSPVFLSPAPLHMELVDWLSPWQGREIWLEAALCQETASVTEQGSIFSPLSAPDMTEGGFFDETLCCSYRTEVLEHAIRFTLFDTPDTLKTKLEKARSLGVTRAVGLYQELGPFLTG